MSLFVRFAVMVLVLSGNLYMGHASAQETIDASQAASRLDKLVDVLEKRIEEKERLQRLVASGNTPAEDAVSELESINQDIRSLENTFELLTVGDIDEAAFATDNEEPFDWRTELMLILEPVFDSLKAITEKPRQMAEIRTEIERNKNQLLAADQAISALESINIDDYEDDTQSKIVKLEKKWLNQKDSIEQRLLSAEEQLDRLQRIEDSPYTGVLPSVREFMLGRGLTLVLAIGAAILSWFFMRLLWWLFSNYMVSKSQRRGSLWFRLMSYSFYIFQFIASVLAVLAVLYAREDLLLLSLILLFLAVTAIGIRRYIPSYIREARLLLNLGSVREGERVFYNNLPWQVNSINLQTVLWNPSLEGIVRLPLETIETLVSRPVKDKNWFPTNKGDYVLLPDDTFGQVIKQTPELLQLRVRGGMIQSFTSSDFYAMNIINLSAGDSYGVSATFGFDYNLQSISLTDIPEKLHEAIDHALQEIDYKNFVEGILVELQSASSSSLDYLVFLTIKSEKASDYFRMQRLIQQVCVAVANREGWNIPFPQMMVHHQAVSE